MGNKGFDVTVNEYDCVFQGWLTEVERKLLEKGSEPQRQSGHFDSQGNTPLTNSYGQNRERYLSP